MVTVGILQFDFLANTAALDAGVAKAEASLAKLEKTAGGLNFDLGGAAASKSIGDLQTTLTRFDTTVKANGDTISKYREEMSATAMATAQLKQAQADAAEMLALYRKNMADVAETQALLKETQVEATEELIKLRAAQTAAADSLTALRVAQTATAESTTLLKDAMTATAQATTALRVAQEATEQQNLALKVSLTAAADALTQQRIAATGAADALTQLRVAQQATEQQNLALKVSATGAADALTAQRTAAIANAQAMTDARVATELYQQQLLAVKVASEEQQIALRAQSAAAQKAGVDMAGLGAATRNAASTMKDAFGGVLDVVKKVAEALGLLVIAEAAVDAVGVKMAADWQSKTNEIQNNTVMTTADVKVMDAAIRDMASRSPASMNDLADGFAHIFNFGNSAADSVKILNVAMESSVATGTKAADTANILASVMHEFKINVDDAGTTMNVLHVAAAEGNQTLQSFVENSAAALSIAANLGVSLNQAAAGFIALSRSGLDASRVNTQMIGIMTHIINPTAAATKEIQRLSKATGIDLVSDFTLFGIQTRGFSGIMADLEKAIAGGSDEILKLIPALRGGTGALALTGSAAGDLDTALSSINDTVAGKTNPTLDAFQRTQETLGFKVGVFKNALRLLAIELGTVLLPVLGKIVDAMTAFGDKIGQIFNVPGLSSAKKQVDDLNAATAAADAQAKKLGGSLDLPGQNGVATARKNVDYLKDSVVDLDAQLLQANTNLADLDAKLNGVRETMQKINTDFRSQIDPLEAKIRDTNDSFKAQIDPLDARIRHANDDYHSQTDPILEQIRRNSLPDAAGLARQGVEANLELQKANLAVSKPDVSQYTDAAQAAQDAKDARDAFDSSSFDANIADAQAWKDSLGEFDATPFTDQIKSIQSEIDGLNTNEFDDKINAIKDKLAEPAPDTQGITNQLKQLEDQLAGGTISQAAFDTSYGALSRQKQGINTKYQDDTTGLNAQLKLLEQQRTDQAQAQKETKQADEAHIRSIQEAQAVAEKEHKAQVDAADASIKESTKERETAKKAYDDETARLDKTIKQNNDKAKVMLKPYTDAVNVVDKQLEYNHALDAAAKMQADMANLPLQQHVDALTEAWKRTVDPLQKQEDLLKGQQKDAIDPLQAKVDHLKNTQQDMINPLQAQLDLYQQQKDVITEQVRQLDLKKTATEAAIKAGGFPGGAAAGGALSVGGALFGMPGRNERQFGATNTPGGGGPAPGSFLSKYDEFGRPVGSGPGDADTRTFLDKIGAAIDQYGPILQAKLGALAQQFLGWLEPYIPRILAEADKVIGAIGDWVAAHAPAIGTQLLAWGQQFVDFIAPYLDPIVKALAPVVDAIGTWIVSTALPMIVQALLKWADEFINWIPPMIPRFLAAALIFQARLILFITETVFAITVALEKWALAFVEWVGPMVLKLLDEMNKLEIQLENWIVEQVVKLVGMLRQWNDAFTSWVGDAAGALPGKLGAVLSAIGTWVSDSAGEMKKLGGDFIGGFLSGVGDALGKLERGVGGAIDWVGGIFGKGDLVDLTKLPGFANGVSDFRGGPAIVGERGPEVMYVPQHATIVPHEDAKAMGMLPGFAGGLNWITDAAGAVKDKVGDVAGAVAGKVGDLVHAATGALADQVMGRIGGPFDVPGALAPLPGSMLGFVKDNVGALIDRIRPHGTANSAGNKGGSGAGFQAMALDAFLAYMAGFGGPLDNESAFNDLMGVGRERNIDPRWFMAIMQTEDGFGTAAGDLLPQYNNYGGMGIRTGGLGYPSPVFATDGGPQPYAAFRSFHDFLEDEASWIIENGTSFAGYQTADAGQGKNAAFAAILAAIPGFAGPTRTAATGGAGDTDALNDALSYVGEAVVPRGQYAGQAWDYFCEVFNEMVAQDLGLGYSGDLTARDHGARLAAAGLLQKGGIPPAGWSTYWNDTFFPGFGGAGHVAISEGDGTFVSSHVGGISDRYGAGWLDHPGLMGYAPPGAAEGGLFSKPTNITIGEGKEREWALPDSTLRETVREEAGGAPTFVFQPGAIAVDKHGNVTVDPAKVTIQSAWAASGHI